MNHQQQEQTKTNAFYFPRLSEYADAFSHIMRELKNIGASPGQIIGFLKNEPEPPDNPEKDGASLELELDFNLEPPIAPTAPATQRQLFTAQQIARKLGVYSMYGRPHAHAISAILNENIRIGKEHIEERILFETDSIILFYKLYDEYAFERAAGWIEANGLPSDVDGYGLTYHIRYI